MVEPISLEELVKGGDLSKEACEILTKKYWITNVNELYWRIRSALENGNEEIKACFAEDLGISPNKLGEYAEYLKHYVSDSVTSPNIRKYPLGCLITKRGNSDGEN